MAEKLNNYFVDIIKELEIETFSDINAVDIETSVCNEIENIVSKFKNHVSILKIKEHVHITEKFSFTNLTTKKVEKGYPVLISKNLL